MRILGIDPGLRSVGLAVVDGAGRLELATMLHNPEEHDDGPVAWEAMAEAVLERIRADFEQGAAALDVAVVERQQVRGKMVNRNPQVMITLANVAGVLIHAIPADRKLAVWPSQWTHNEKEAWVSVRRSLTPDELKRCELYTTTPSSEHNLWDAVGIARWGAHQARLQTGTVRYG